ncbi:MAG: ribosomal protein S18-alanine N-acetyltransferase [Moorea sp. SIO4E2]|nr:ribosomal protein S18-alanine N-acetyltransferase [Moorena sp. SIO4E2]
MKAVTVLKLKPLKAEHLSAAVALDQLCFGGLWTRSGYERELDSPNSQLLALEAPPKGGKKPTLLEGTGVPITSLPNWLVGLGCFWSILEEAHIIILAVHPDYQRQGLGQLLLYSLLKEAKQRNLKWATLEVKPSNQAALALYQKFGFTKAGRRRNYYKDTGEDALILWRGGLKTPEFEKIMADCYEEIKQRLAAIDLEIG